MERDQMLTLLMGFVLTRIQGKGWDKAKELAVTRYMRTTLPRVTDLELSLWLDQCSDLTSSPMLTVKSVAKVAEAVTSKAQVRLHPDLEFIMDKASKGYDSFMARRGVAVK